jgi:hypothetical protein
MIPVNLPMPMMYDIFRAQDFLGPVEGGTLMNRRFFQSLLLLILFAGLGTLACDVSTLTSLAQGGASKPQVTIQLPLAGTSFHEGDDVTVQSTSTDKSGVVRVELLVDGAVVRTDAPPIAQGQASFSVLQTWKATAGNHTLGVRAYNAANAASDPALVAITVTSGVAALPSPTADALLPPLGGTPINPAILLTPTLPPTGVDATPTKRPPTLVPPTATISAPPGVWGVSVRVDPSKPQIKQPMTFFVKFLNTTSAPQHFKWYVKIYEPDAKNSKGETPKSDNDFPVGTTELQSPPWTLTNLGACQDYIARAYWVDPNNNNVIEFSKPDKSGGPAAGFQVCP